MTTFKAYILHAFWVPEEWEFTGKIKYEKYTQYTVVYFEIAYTERIRKKWYNKLEIVTEWIHEKSIRLVEIPETTIYDCGD